MNQKLIKDIEFIFQQLGNQNSNCLDLSHKEIQNFIANILEENGYKVEIEKGVMAKRHGYIDLVAQKEDYLIGLEIDHRTIRKKSIDKINHLDPNLGIFILKSKKPYSLGQNSKRLKLVKYSYLVVNLFDGKIFKR